MSEAFEAKKKNPNAICFIGSPCPKLDVTRLPKHPCQLHQRWPTAICRDRMALDGTQQDASKENKQTSEATAPGDGDGGNPCKPLNPPIKSPAPRPQNSFVGKQNIKEVKQ